MKLKGYVPKFKYKKIKFIKALYNDQYSSYR